MSISAIWLFLKSGAGKILAGALAVLAVFLRIQWVKNQRDNASRAAEVAKSEAKAEAAKTKIGGAISKKRTEVKQQQAERQRQEQVNQDKAKAEGRKDRSGFEDRW